MMSRDYFLLFNHNWINEKKSFILCPEIIHFFNVSFCFTWSKKLNWAYNIQVCNPVLIRILAKELCKEKNLYDTFHLNIKIKLLIENLCNLFSLKRVLNFNWKPFMYWRHPCEKEKHACTPWKFSQTYLCCQISDSTITKWWLKTADLK